MSQGGLLLDLDGTLVDTAPDMVASLNQLLAEEGQPLLDYLRGRMHVSDGAAGLIAAGLAIERADGRMPRLRDRYLEIYAARICEQSTVFDGFAELFPVLAEVGWRWGVVTNKPRWLAQPLLAALGLQPDRDCLIGGDTLHRRKPHPEPLLLAARRLAVAPKRCVYVGDAPRDIQAGRAAGMLTIAARYGYLPDPAEVPRWAADVVVDSPAEMVPLVRRLAREIARAG